MTETFIIIFLFINMILETIIFFCLEDKIVTVQDFIKELAKNAKL